MRFAKRITNISPNEIPSRFTSTEDSKTTVNDSTRCYCFATGNMFTVFTTDIYTEQNAEPFVHCLRDSVAPYHCRAARTVTAKYIRRLYYLVGHVQPRRACLTTCLPISPEFSIPPPPTLGRDTVRAVSHLKRLPGERRTYTRLPGIDRRSSFECHSNFAALRNTGFFYEILYYIFSLRILVC